MMSLVADKNTKPEILVQKTIRSLGYRFSLHRKNLAGCPDIVLAKMRRIIFVHGCFWHCHKGCGRASRPKTNVNFWDKKLDSNVKRDRKNRRTLKKDGWQVLVIWECQTKSPERLGKKLRKYLSGA
jgi:DNA mismatch endonuclease (patch repair protein)